MVLIAAAVCSKSGKAVISRQFVEMTKECLIQFNKVYFKFRVCNAYYYFHYTKPEALVRGDKIDEHSIGMSTFISALMYSMSHNPCPIVV